MIQLSQSQTDLTKKIVEQAILNIGLKKLGENIGIDAREIDSLACDLLDESEDINTLYQGNPTSIILELFTGKVVTAVVNRFTDLPIKSELLYDGNYFRVDGQGMSVRFLPMQISLHVDKETLTINLHIAS